MSKRFAGLSVILIASVFMPWFSVNVLITKVSFPAYKLGVAGVLVVVLGVLGLVGSQIKQERFRALVETIVGALTLIFVWLSNSIFHTRIDSMVNRLVGGFGGDSSGLGQALGKVDVSQAIGSAGFGFYIALIVGLLLLGFGAQAVYIRRAEKLLPDQWNAELFRSNLKKVGSAAAETAATAEARIKGADWSWTQKWSLKTVRGKSVLGVIGLAVVYVGALLWYNSAHSLVNTTKSLLSAITAKNANVVASDIVTDNQLSPGAVDGFVNYYSGHLDDLKNMLGGITADAGGSGDSLSNLLSTNNSSATVQKHDMFGFTTYKLHFPAVQVKLAGPDGSKFTMGGKAIDASFFVLPAQYSVTDTVGSAFGPVSDTETVDATNGNNADMQFQFSNNTLNLTSEISGDATLVINGKTSKVTFPNQGFGSNQLTLSPVPIKDGDTISIITSMPWGKWTESGQVQSGQCNLQPDSGANRSTLEDISKVIDAYNTSWAKDANAGKYNDSKTTAYLVNGSLAYQNYTNQNGAQAVTYTKMDLSPDMKLIQLSDGNQGIEVQDSEHYTGSGSNELDWAYDLEYNKSNSTWQIQNNSNSFTQINENTPGVLEINH